MSTSALPVTVKDIIPSILRQRSFAGLVSGRGLRLAFGSIRRRLLNDRRFVRCRGRTGLFRALAFQGLVDDQPTQKYGEASENIGPGGARLHHLRYRTIVDSGDRPTSSVVEVAGPSGGTNLLGCGGKVLACLVQVLVVSTIDHVPGCVAQAVNGCVAGLGIEEPVAERVMAERRGAIPDGETSLQIVPCAVTDRSGPAAALVARDVAYQAVCRIVRPPVGIGGREQPVGRPFYLIADPGWRGTAAEPSMLLSTLIQPTHANTFFPAGAFS